MERTTTRKKSALNMVLTTWSAAMFVSCAYAAGFVPKLSKPFVFFVLFYWIYFHWMMKKNQFLTDAEVDGRNGLKTLKALSSSLPNLTLGSTVVLFCSLAWKMA